MARKKAEVKDEDRPRDTRGSGYADTRPGRLGFVPPNEQETAAIVESLPKNLDPSSAQIERALKRLIRLGKLRPEALGGAKALAVEAIDKIESRTESVDPIQTAKVVNSRYFVGGEKEPETATELEAEKISRESGFKESTRGVDPGADKMEHPRVRKLLALAMRGKEGRKSVRSRLLKQKREGTKLFAEDKEEDKKRRPSTVGERVAQIVRLPAEPASAVEEMAGGEYTGKGSRGLPKIADTGGLQRRPRVETGRTVATQFLRTAGTRPNVVVEGPSQERAEQLVERKVRSEAARKKGESGLMQGPLTKEEANKIIKFAREMREKIAKNPRVFPAGSPEAMDPEATQVRKMIGSVEAENIPIRHEAETVPVQGPLRKMPRGPRTQAGKPIQYAFEDSGRPMGMSPSKFEDIRLVEGVPFDKTMYAKLDRLARGGDLGAARVLAKMRTKAFGARKGQEAGEVMNPETKKTKFKTAAQKARGRAKQESRAMGRTATEEARRVMKGKPQRTGGKSAPIRMNLKQAADAAQRQLRMEAGRKAGGRGKIQGPLTRLQFAAIGEAARRMSP
jgi:hypothetical protein